MEMHPIKHAEQEAWKHPIPNDPAVSKLLYELQLTAYEEAVESYRNCQKQFDPIIIFGGAAIGWLVTFITKQASFPARPLLLAAVFFAGASVVTAFLGRRSFLRPAIISLSEALAAVGDRDEHAAHDWIARTMHVNRRGFWQILEQINKWYCAAVTLVALAIVFAFFGALCSHPDSQPAANASSSASR